MPLDTHTGARPYLWVCLPSSTRIRGNVLVTGNAIHPTGIAQVVVENRAFNQPDSVNVLQDGFYAPSRGDWCQKSVFTQQVLNL